eukprot:10297215-Alexandrium_andersonii.AAC.1
MVTLSRGPQASLPRPRASRAGPSPACSPAISSQRTRGMRETLEPPRRAPRSGRRAPATPSAPQVECDSVRWGATLPSM